VLKWSVSELSAVGLLTLRHCIRDSKAALCMASRSARQAAARFSRF
jgi:hypothetical protein